MLLRMLKDDKKPAKDGSKGPPSKGPKGKGDSKGAPPKGKDGFLGKNGTKPNGAKNGTLNGTKKMKRDPKKMK